MAERALLLFGLSLALAACASRPPRDSVDGQDKERRVDPNEVPAYEHMARRAHGTVALAESRGLDRGEAAGATEGLADRLDACVRQGGVTGPGLARVVARVADDGTVDGLNVQVEPGQAPTALRCLVSPVKLLVFRPGAKTGPTRPEGSVSRGFAIEAQWHP